MAYANSLAAKAGCKAPFPTVSLPSFNNNADEKFGFELVQGFDWTAVVHSAEDTGCVVIPDNVNTTNDEQDKEENNNVDEVQLNNITQLIETASNLSSDFKKI